MKPLLSLAEFIDEVNNRFGTLAGWAVLLSCFISCANAVLRFGFSLSSNAWLEIQWYLFAGAVMLGASMVLRVNEHVRVDVFYGQLSARIKVMVDLFGSLLCLALYRRLAITPTAFEIDCWSLCENSLGGSG